MKTRALVVFILVILAECAVCPDSGEICYRFFSGRKTWHGANSICERYGSQLAEPKSFEKNEIFLSVVRLVGAGGDLWLGARETETPGVYQWQAEGDNLTWTDWGQRQPDGNQTDDNQRHCLVLHDVASGWDDVPCTSFAAFVCQTRKEQWQSFDGSQKSHKVFSDSAPRNFAESKLFCNKMGFDLPEPRSKEEVEHLNSLRSPGFFLGLTYQKTAWSWDNQPSNLSFQLWGRHEGAARPPQFCAWMRGNNSTDMTWKDTDCDLTKNTVVCERHGQVLNGRKTTEAETVPNGCKRVCIDGEYKTYGCPIDPTTPADTGHQDKAEISDSMSTNDNELGLKNDSSPERASGECKGNCDGIPATAGIGSRHELDLVLALLVLSALTSLVYVPPLY